MLIVGDTQYENDPGVLALLASVVRAHPDAIGYMSLIEDAIHVVVKTPKPKPAKAPRARPNADESQSDDPEAKAEQAPIRPPHLEVLKWGPVKAELRTRPGCGKLQRTLTVRGEPGAWNISPDILKSTAKGFESYIKLGDTVAEPASGPR